MLLVKNGRVIDPASGTDAVVDVLLDGAFISKVGANLVANGAEVFDAKGLVVAPGFIDLHCHLREPGQEMSETIETGTRAAARGGFTAVCTMPNTQPVNDSASVTRGIVERAACTLLLLWGHAKGHKCAFQSERARRQLGITKFVIGPTI